MRLSHHTRAAARFARSHKGRFRLNALRLYTPLVVAGAPPHCSSLGLGFRDMRDHGQSISRSGRPIIT